MQRKNENILKGGSRNPELSRANMPHFSTHERKTKNKTRSLADMMRKHKRRNAYDHYQEDHKHFYFAFCDN
ncbi:hypothetical protein ACEQPO_18110 [Bacillus sp. SL00103]